MLGKLIREWKAENGAYVLRAYQTQRRTGVRIQVSRANGPVLFDTGDCYDLGNAMNKVELWAKENLAALEAGTL